MSLCRRLRGWRWRSTGGRIVSEDVAFGSLSPVGGFTHFGGVVGVIVVRAGGISWTWTHPRGRRRRWPRVSRSFRWVAPREPARRRSRRARPRVRAPGPGGRHRGFAAFVQAQDGCVQGSHLGLEISVSTSATVKDTLIRFKECSFTVEDTSGRLGERFRQFWRDAYFPHLVQTGGRV